MDTRINHWIRCIMDDIFGYDNFRNEIVWWYKKFSQNNNNTFLTNHDYLVMYSKADKYTFNPQYITNKDKEKRMEKGYFNCGGGKYLVYSFDKFNKFSQDKNIPNDKIKDKTKDTPLIRLDDVFTDIMFLNSQSKERIGYDTQKPKALLERIIKASSNEGDLVADFYMGSGTTAEVCQDLNRNFIGCDINPRAIEVTKERLNKREEK